MHIIYDYKQLKINLTVHGMYGSISMAISIIVTYFTSNSVPTYCW